VSLKKKKKNPVKKKGLPAFIYFLLGVAAFPVFEYAVRFAYSEDLRKKKNNVKRVRGGRKRV
jgi:hypothetical protein